MLVAVFVGVGVFTATDVGTASTQAEPHIAETVTVVAFDVGILGCLGTQRIVQ